MRPAGGSATTTPTGSIGLVGEEPDPPYSRPPLSKAALAGEGRGDDLARHRRARGRARTSAAGSSRSTWPARRVTDERGESYGYEQAAARDGRPAAAPAGRHRRRGRLLPRAPRLPPPPRARRPRGRLRRARRRLHRLGARGRAPRRRLQGDDRLPRGGHRRAALPGRARGVGRRSSTAATASRCCPGELVAGVEPGTERFAVALAERRASRGRRRRRGARGRARGPSSPSRGPEVSDGIVVDEYGRAGETGDVYAAGDVARFPGAAARDHDPGRARGPGKQPRPRGRGEHGRRRRALRPPALLLLRPLRARLRGGRRGRLAPADGRRVGRAAAARASSPTSTRRAGRAGSCSSTSGARSTPRPR